MVQVVRRKRQRGQDEKRKSDDEEASRRDEGKENDGNVNVEVEGGAKDGDKLNDTVTRSSNSNNSGRSSGRSKGDMQITVTRVSLHDPLHQHDRHWNATLLPRLSSFVDAIYSVRRDDGKRYRLLMALAESQLEVVVGGTNDGKVRDDDGNANDADVRAWGVLWDECPWLRHCDTAFGRRRG